MTSDKDKGIFSKFKNFSHLQNSQQQKSLQFFRVGNKMKVWILGALAALGVAVIVGFQSSTKLRIAVELLGWKGFFTVVRDSAAHRLGARLTHSRSAYHRLLDTLSEVDLNYCVPQRRIQDETDIAECHRAVAHHTITAFRLLYETDLIHPHFEPIVGPHLKSLGDNPDALYHLAAISPEYEYIVQGRIQGEVYLSITLYETKCVGCFADLVVADMNHRQLKSLNPETGQFSIILTKSKNPPDDQQHDYVYMGERSTPNASLQVVFRHYFENEQMAQTDPTIPRRLLSIRNLNPTVASQIPNRLGDDESATRLDRVTNYVRAHTVDMVQDPSKSPSWFSFTPNKFGPAKLFREESVGLGAVDIVYSAGPFRMEDPDSQGVLVEGEMPRCAFANLCLWNRLMQTFGYENGRPVSINRRQMKRSNLDPKALTGKFKILISKRHPAQGLPSDWEWLDSEGRPDGTMFFRFLLPEEQVVTPTARLVQLDNLS